MVVVVAVVVAVAVVVIIVFLVFVPHFLFVVVGLAVVGDSGVITSRNLEMLCNRRVCVCECDRDLWDCCGACLGNLVETVYFSFFSPVVLCPLCMKVPDCEWVCFVRGRANCVPGSARVCI